jgi:hypothetical protein
MELGTAFTVIALVVIFLFGEEIRDLLKALTERVRRNG